jgi:glycosyltransferase involved in cell wall biosynthesis
MGVGAAIQTGINYAKKIKPDILVILDADGQHNPGDIPKLIKPILLGEADFIIGSRIYKNDNHMKTINLLGNRILNLIVSIIVKKMIHDSQSGFRALNKNSIMDVTIKGNKTYVQEMIIDLSLKNKKIKEIFIETNHRKFGNSKVTSNIFDYAIKSTVIIMKSFIRNL